MVKKESRNLLTNAELQALRPRERIRYVQNLMLKALDTEKNLTLSEIIGKTSLARPTVTKHLELLVALQQVRKEERGMGRIKIAFYKRIGEIANTHNIKYPSNDQTSYSFFVLDSEDGRSICIQQKEEDEYKTSKVKGAIVIKYEDFERFIKELHAYGAKVIQK